MAVILPFRSGGPPRRLVERHSPKDARVAMLHRDKDQLAVGTQGAPASFVKFTVFSSGACARMDIPVS
jgi:hypothetical protein